MKTHASNDYDLSWSIIWLSSTGRKTRKKTWIEKSEKSDIVLYPEYENVTREPTELLFDFGLGKTCNLMFSWHTEAYRNEMLFWKSIGRGQSWRTKRVFFSVFSLIICYDWSYLYFRVHWNWSKAYVSS